MRNWIALGAATGVVGVTFGVLAETAGLSLWQAMTMSLLVFTGASQFAIVSIAVAGGSMFAAVGGALLLGARNGLYGVRMSQVLEERGLRRMVAAHLVIDESTGMALLEDNPAEQRRAFWVTGLAVFTFWNIGTVVGVLAGSVVGNPETYGLDVAFPASFVALLWPHLGAAAGRHVALIAAATALIAVPLLPAGAPVLVAALAVVPVGASELRAAAKAQQ